MAHSAILTWGAAADATSASTYNVYRAVGACPATGLGSLSFSKLGNTAVLAFTDATVAIGNSYCYYATQEAGGFESVPSNTAGGNVTPDTVTIQLVLS